jgi:hypothetical protein
MIILETHVGFLVLLWFLVRSTEAARLAGPLPMAYWRY